MKAKEQLGYNLNSYFGGDNLLMNRFESDIKDSFPNSDLRLRLRLKIYCNLGDNFRFNFRNPIKFNLERII